MEHPQTLALGICCYLISFILLWGFHSYDLSITQIWWLDWALPLFWSAIFPLVVFKDNYINAKVSLKSAFLGWSTAVGTSFLLSDDPSLSSLGMYICILANFHFSEFLFTTMINEKEVNPDAFLLNHSPEYGIANFCSLLEYLLEAYFFYDLKFLTPKLHIISLIGFSICLLGEVIRKSAMLTAGRNFTHLVRDQKVKGHELITSGIYGICRHPSYLGWYLWSFGTQLILLNPVCFVGYVIVSYKFFHSRIFYEEACLLNIFGMQYVKYQEKVPFTGIPFVKGYLVSGIQLDVDDSEKESD